MMRQCYIAGPMKGFPAMNFDAFIEAASTLRRNGWSVISPAEMDMQEGFNPHKTEPTKQFLDEAMKRDVEAIIHRADAMVMLPGWEKSTGAQAELWLAKWKHIPVYLYPSMVLLEDECILDEASRITKGSRQEQYGGPKEDFSRVAAMWSALKGVPFEAQDVAMFMICLKLGRQAHKPGRDNSVDIAGYARCMHLCNTP